MKGPGVKPPQVGPFKREVIGPDECPIMHRWTLFDVGKAKLLLHHFLPNADDRATHDHPRPFVTLVLRGGYLDMVPCATCKGSGEARANPSLRCPSCWGDGLVVGDRMRAGMVRYRRAEHQHRTRVGPDGCWTLVLMGPLARAWGFIVDGEWMPWREHERKFGFGMRCGDEGADS